MATRRTTRRRLARTSPPITQAVETTNTTPPGGTQQTRREQRLLRRNTETTPSNPLTTNNNSTQTRRALTRYSRRTTTRPDVEPRISIGVPVGGNERPRKNDIQYSNDVLNVAEYEIENENFQLVDKNGISSFRPEIISLIDFQPIYEKNLTTNNIVGNYIDFQYQALSLRRDTLVEMLSAINEWSPKEIETVVANMTSEFRTSLDRTQRTINSYISYINTIENIKNSINIKSLSIPKETTRPIKAEIVTNKTLQGFFERNLQYNKNQFDLFSNTKVYLQFISDLRSIVENYSFGLLSLTDPDRNGDYNPIDIDNTYTTKDGFSFSVDTIRSSTTSKNFTVSSNFNQFLNSLPKTVDDRIKLLVTFLSKEFRVSKNLANKTLQTKLADKFGSAPGTGADGTGNPFDNILGIPGDTIFESPVGVNSLAALAYIDFNDSFSVLSFENKYIDFNGEDKKSFVPGVNYLVDSILKIQNNQFNTKPFVDYSDLVTLYVTDAVSALEQLFELKNKNSQLKPNKMLQKLFLMFKGSSSGISTKKLGDKTQAFSLALIKLANTDNILKNMLFQFLCLAGIYSLTATDEKTIFRLLATELGTTDALGYVQRINNSPLDLVDNGSQAYPYLELTAKNIIKRVVSLVNKDSKKSEANIIITQNVSQTRARNILNRPTIITSNDSNKDILTLVATQQEMETLLLGLIAPSNLASTNIFKGFVDLVNHFSKNANDVTEGYVLSDNSGRTRYNFISTSAQLLICYELVCSLSDKYSFSTFSRTNDKAYVGIVSNIVDNLMINNILEEVLTLSNEKRPSGTRRVTGNNVSTTTVQQINQSGDSVDRLNRRNNLRRDLFSNDIEVDESSSKYKTYLSNLETIKKKIEQEDSILYEAISILNGLNKAYTDTKNTVLSSFNANRISQFLKENTLEELKLISNPAQVKLAYNIFENYKNRLANGIPIETNSGNKFNNIIIADYPRPQEMTAMYSLLKQPEFNASNTDERMKILTVGIPAGFINQLSNRLVGNNINRSSFTSKKQNDIVSINVYMRDNRYSDIVFKPKKYLFDLSLIKSDIGYKNAVPNRNESFSKLVERINLEDVADIMKVKQVSLNDLHTNTSYRFLNKDELKEMIINHVQSDLLATYIRFLSSLDLTEKTYTVKDIQIGTSTNEGFQKIIKGYINSFTNNQLNQSLNFQQILLDPLIDEETKDIVRLSTFGSITFEPSILRQKTISSKLFDRVFHLPLTVEFFEIDENQTRSTQNGYNALRQDFLQDKLFRFRDRLFLKLSSDEDIIFSDFFVNVETIED
jgi:hypothetical protein